MAHIIYNSWNEMLRARDDLNTSYIRKSGNGWELVKYVRWNKDIYFAYCGPSSNSLFELIIKLKKQGYDLSNVDKCECKVYN